MGYQLQPNAPQITVQGRIFAIGSFLDNSPSGNTLTGVFELKVDGWNLIYPACDYYLNPGEYVAAIQKAGGGVKYVQMIVDKINAFFATLFTVVTPPSTEPITDEEALAFVTAHLNAMKLTLVNGVPVLA